MVWSHLNTCFLDVCSYIRTRPHTTRMCCCSFGMSDKIRHAYFRCDIMDNQTFVPFINLCLRWQILWWKWYTLSWCCLTLVATGYDSFFSKFSLNSLISLSLSLSPPMSYCNSFCTTSTLLWVSVSTFVTCDTLVEKIN